MPVIDMPLAELKNYRGINPRPDDFDAYWDKALQELYALPAEPELLPADFPVPFAETYDLYFTGTNGARIHVLYLKPKHLSTPHPAILEFHGYTGDSGAWSSKLKWVAAGFSVLAMDVRGQGGASTDPGGSIGTTWNGHIIRGLEDSPEKLFYRHIFLDTVQLARIAMNLPEVDPERIGAVGASQGGALTVACAALVPQIKKAAPMYPFLADYRRIWEMDLAIGCYEELVYFFRNFDPRHEKEEDIFARLGYIDIQNLAPRIQGDILFATGLMDTSCPPSTQFAVYNKIVSNKEMVIYPDFKHERIPDFEDRTYSFMLEL